MSKKEFMSEKKEVKTENVKSVEEKKQEFLFSDAEYRKFENRRLEYSNALIGTIDEKGGYKITPEILKEFVAIPKVIREIHENRYYAIATAQKPAYTIKFSIIVGNVDDEKKYATLCLLEDVISPSTGAYSLKSTPIATFRDDNDGYFVTKMKKAFNLKSVEEQVDGGLFDETKFPNFYAAKSKKLKLKGKLDAESEEADEIYVVEMLKELKKMGKYGEWVLKNLILQQKAMGDKFPKKGSKDFFKIYARLLDQAIFNARTFPMTPEQVAALNRIQQMRMDRLKTATTEVVLVPPKAVKKAAKSADKSSGGGAKPKAKKAAKPQKKDDKPKAKKAEKKKPYKFYFPHNETPKTEMETRRKDKDDYWADIEGMLHSEIEHNKHIKEEISEKIIILDDLEDSEIKSKDVSKTKIKNEERSL